MGKTKRNKNLTRIDADKAKMLFSFADESPKQNNCFSIRFANSAGKGFHFVLQHKLEIAFYFLDASQKRKSFLALSAKIRV